MSLQLHPAQRSPLVTTPIHAVIEIRGGTREKYVHNLENDGLKLIRLLRDPLPSNIHYGYIPKTISDDGDALDVVVLSSRKPVALSTMEIKPIGIMWTHDEKGPDDKIISVDVADPLYSESNPFRRSQILDDFAPILIGLLVSSKDKEKDMWAKFLSFGKEDAAYSKIAESMQIFAALKR